VLSCCDEELAMVHALFVPNFDLFDQFRHEAATVLEIITKRQEIESGAVDPAWAIVDDMVAHHDRMFMPAPAPIWGQVLHHTHGVGHEGVQKTLHVG
jgi:hypothetical protein